MSTLRTIGELYPVKVLKRIAFVVASIGLISLTEFAVAQTDEDPYYIPEVDDSSIPPSNENSIGGRFSNNPTSIATIDGQTFYITENNVNSTSGGDVGVAVFFSDSSGSRRLLVGSSTGGSSQFATNNSPNGVAVDLKGNVFVADTANNEVEIFKTEPVRDSYLSGQPFAKGKDIITRRFDFIGKFPAGRFTSPNGIAVDLRENVYVADTANYEIDIFYSDGTTTRLRGGFDKPTGVAVDLKGNIYVADTGNNRVDIFNSNLDRIHRLTGFNRPIDVAVDSFGNISVVDAGNKEVDLFDSNRQLKSSVRGFRGPADLTVDSSGKVYVLDVGFRTSPEDFTTNARIRALTATPVSRPRF